MSPRPKPKQERPSEPISLENVHKLMGACSMRGAAGIRNAALIATLYGGALRLAEALALRPADVDLDEGEVMVRNGKGGKAGRVGFPAGWVSLAVQRWMEKRKALGISSRAPLFCTISTGRNSEGKAQKPGQPLQQAYVRALLPRLARKAGIERRVHAHGLRASRACHMVADPDTSFGAVVQALRHSRPDTTSKYLRKINPELGLKAMQRPVR